MIHTGPFPFEMLRDSMMILNKWISDMIAHRVRRITWRNTLRKSEPVVINCGISGAKRDAIMLLSLQWTVSFALNQRYITEETTLKLAFVGACVLSHCD